MAISFAPRRGNPDHVSPSIPKSLVQHAEQVVIQRARELVKDWARGMPTERPTQTLAESVRVLDTVKGV